MSQVAFCVDSLSMTAGGIPWITSLTSGWHSTLHPRDWMSSWSTQRPPKKRESKATKTWKMRTALVSGSQQPLNIANLRYLAKVFNFSRGDHNKNSTRTGWKQAVGLNGVRLGKWTTWCAIWWGDPISIELMVGKGLLRVWRILGPNEALFLRIKSGQLRSPKMWRVEF